MNRHGQELLTIQKKNIINLLLIYINDYYTLINSKAEHLSFQVEPF